MSMCIFILVNVNCSSPIKKIIDMGQRKDQSFFMKKSLVKEAAKKVRSIVIMRLFL